MAAPHQHQCQHRGILLVEGLLRGVKYALVESLSIVFCSVERKRCFCGRFFVQRTTNSLGLMRQLLPRTGTLSSLSLSIFIY